MTRSVPVAVLLVVLAAGGVAHADGMLPGGAQLTFSKLEINENGNGFQQPSGPVAQRKYFNLPHCQCSQLNMGKETQFEYLLTLSQVTGTHRGAQIWTGIGCGDVNNRSTTAQMCRSITDMGVNGDMGMAITDIDSLVPSGFTLKLSTYDVFAGFDPKKGCVPDETDKTIWILMDTTGNGTLDFNLPQIAGKTPGDTTTPGLGMDTYPPPAPQNLSAQPSEGGIQLSWSAPTARANDINAYQALCARAADGSAVRTSPPSPLYQTTSSLCGIPDDPSLITAGGAAMATDANPLPTGMQNLDGAFICGQQDSSTATNMSIDGLENGVPYYVMVVAVDLHGNYSGVYLPTPITPVPSRDFWQDLHDRGSKTEGGLCLLAETYGNDSVLTGALRAFRDNTLGASRVGRWLTTAYYTTLARLGARVHGSVALRIAAAILLAPAVALALLWHWLTLYGLLGLIAAAVVWRRWRAALARRAVRLLRPRAAASAVALMIALVAGRALADGGGYRPYWEDNDSLDQTKPAAGAADDVEWHVGVRIGPYVPQVDAQLGGPKPGPYEQMFGGYHILTMLDVDRIVWSGFGQVGIGFSAGYWQKTARTFTIDSMPSDNMRPRAADHNAFRLIPTELSATYRFTWLDDNYGVPTVPYARAGLGYYIWWISVADHYAHACANPTNSAFCAPGQSHNDKALGATAGVQGAIGLAIRAERIDASTAMSMQQSGIQHAGIYAELSDARIHGFGSDTKLSVGDLTWFAGVDFEF
jgi:hypothetical protein